MLTKIAGTRPQAFQQALETAGFLVVEIKDPNDVNRHGAQAVAVSEWIGISWG